MSINIPLSEMLVSGWLIMMSNIYLILCCLSGAGLLGVSICVDILNWLVSNNWLTSKEMI